jgi:GAF domain
MTPRAKPKNSRAPRRAAAAQSRPPRTISSVRRREYIVGEVSRTIETDHGEWSARLARLARACIPDLGEMCIVDVVLDDGTVDRVDAVHVDPSHEEQMRAMRGPFRLRQDHPLTDVIASGQPLLLRNVDDRDLTRIARDTTHLVLLRHFGPRSSMRLPVVLRGRTAAVVTFCVTEPSRRYSQADLDLAVRIIARFVTTVTIIE